jgi:hypothetical protein
VLAPVPPVIVGGLSVTETTFAAADDGHEDTKNTRNTKDK